MRLKLIVGFGVVLALLLLALLPGAAVSPTGWTVVAWNNLGMHCMDADFALFAILPFLLAPLLFLPRLVEFYRGPRIEVAGPAGRWLPPGDEGALFARLAAHLRSVGAKDRDLVVLPEAGALSFLLGVRSPLRFEHVLPGCVDDRVDRDLAEGLDRARPARVVVISRPTSEFGRSAFGRDYGTEIAARLGRDYAVEATFGEGSAAAVVLRRR